MPNTPDVEIPLIHQGSGLWTATWTPAMGASGVTLLARVSASVGHISPPTGGAALSGTVREATADAASAVISILNGARTDLAAETAAGAWVTLTGTGLADTPSAAATAPYPTILEGTQVLMQNRPLTLSYVSPGQIDAFVPAGMNAGNAATDGNPRWHTVVGRGCTGKSSGAGSVQPGWERAGAGRHHSNQYRFSCGAGAAS